MQKNNFNNIYCSRDCQDFTLLYDGFGTYYLYYQEECLTELEEDLNPKEIHKNNNWFAPYSNFKETNNNEFLNQLLDNIEAIIDNTPKNQHKIMTILRDLIRTIKDAEVDPTYNAQYFTNAPAILLDKAREISANMGYEEDIFNDLVKPIDIEEEIQQRVKPILTNEEKAKADAIAVKINEMGLLPYLDSILDNIHLGEHKNIYRKTLAVFKIMRGEASFISETTAKAEQGKSFEDDIVFGLITPKRYIFEVNQITEASFIRKCFIAPNYYDRLIILFGDLGSNKSFKKVEPILNIVKPLITEGKYNYIKSDTDSDIDVIEIPLKVCSIGAGYQTTKNSFTEDDAQLISRTIYSTPAMVEPKEIARQIFYQRDSNSNHTKAKNNAEQDLKDFGLYLLQMVNTDIEIINPYFDVFWDYASKSDAPIREFKQQLELFDAYCILTKDKCESENYGTLFASETQLKEYMDFVNLENALIPYEYDFLNMIMAKGKTKELTILYDEADINDAEDKGTYLDLDVITSLTECENTAIEQINEQEMRQKKRYDEDKYDYEDLIQSKGDLSPQQLKRLPQKLLANYGFRSAGAKQLIFFRLNDLKSYYGKRTAYKNIDNVSQLLQTLHNKGYLGKYEYKHNRENLYYLTPMCNNLENEFKLNKSYNDYVSDYFTNTGVYNR